MGTSRPSASVTLLRIVGGMVDPAVDHARDGGRLLDPGHRQGLAERDLVGLAHLHLLRVARMPRDSPGSSMPVRAPRPKLVR